jgi:Uma2 family endonuclease
MVVRASKLEPATLADLEVLPPHLEGELIDGVLYAMTRPRPAHPLVAMAMLADVYPGWHPGRGGPGGWWIVPGPGLQLPGAEAICPDVAGWKRTRMPGPPREVPFTLVPDWVCEILSPSTRRHDLLIKLPFYARAGVAWCWMVDLDGEVVSAFRHDEGTWRLEGSFGDEHEARVPPFDAISVDLAAWWAGLGESAEPA